MTKQSKINKPLYFLITSIFLFLFNRFFSNYFVDLSQTSTNNNWGINLKYIENTGAAFSILQDYNLFLICFSIFAVIFIIWYLLKNINTSSTIEVFWYSVLIAGICSNLYERVVFGFIKDYFQTTFIHFPIFNLSDIFINISVVAIIFMLFTKKLTK